MRMSRVIIAGLALAAATACDGLPYAPKWNVDVFFPIKYPDVQLSQVSGIVPPFSVTFTTPADSQNVSDATREILQKDLDTLKAEVVFSTTTNITGTLNISISPNRAFLFSTNPAQAVTIAVPVRVTPGDTTRLLINTGLLKNAQKIYTQSSGNIRSNSATTITMGPNDKLSVGVDLTANIKMSK
jgi:hypothetical protein